MIEEFPKEERAYPEAGWGEPKSDKLFVLVCNGWYLMDEDFDLFRDPWNFKGTLTDDVRYALYLPDDIHCLSKATVVFREAFETQFGNRPPLGSGGVFLEDVPVRELLFPRTDNKCFCGSDSVAHGLCNRHYLRHRRRLNL